MEEWIENICVWILEECRTKISRKKRTEGLAGSHRPPLCFADKDSQTSTDSKTCERKKCTYCKTVFICKKRKITGK